MEGIEIKYWIFVTNAKTWETVRDKNIWGSDARKVRGIEKGNKAVVYVMETKTEEVVPPRIKGAYEVISEPYEARKRIFPGGTYPNRVKLKPEIVLKEDYVDFRELVSDLEFIENKKYWMVYLRTGLNDMPKKDYEFIKTKLEEKT